MSDLMVNKTCRDSSKARHEPLDLNSFFAPRSVVVIGASPKQGNLGKYIVQNLLHQNYPGSVLTVHSEGVPVADCPVVKEIKDMPETVELAIVAVSATKVLPLLQPLAAKGVHHLIVVSGGFAETGEKGAILQNQIQEEARHLGLRIMGPNGLGVFSSLNRFNSFFLKPDALTLPTAGPVAFISQSGAFLLYMLNHLGEQGVGVHRAVNFGNRIDIGECELLEEFARDPEVGVIGLYLESVQDGPRFMEIARAVARSKPVVVFKGGKTARGQQAALSHSASLAGSYNIFKAACKQTGMIEVSDLESMVDALQLFSAPLKIRGNRTLVISNGGGMGVLMTDLCESAGLQVPEPSRKHRQYLEKEFPSYFSFRNPIDLTGSGTNEQCASIAEYLMKTGEFDVLLLVLLPGTEGITEEIGSLLKSRLPGDVPMIIGAYGNLFLSLRDTLTNMGVPVYPTGERAAQTLKRLVQHCQENVQPSTIKIDDLAPFDSSPTRHWLRSLEHEPHEMQIKNLLSQCNISVPAHIHANSEEDIHWAIEGIGFPLILKCVAPDIKHKTELQGLRFDLNDERTLLAEWERFSSNWSGRVWAEQQMPPGLDLMVGAHRDPQFGPILLFGTGGTYVELYGDIARLVLPATDEELIRGIQKTKAWNIIQGFRGNPPLDNQKLFAFLKWVAHWVTSETGIHSLDFNPVRLYEKELVVLDAKITQVTP